MLRLSLAWLHLLALGVGIAAVWSRAASLSGKPDVNALRRAFTADTWWATAAVVWIATGLWRLLAETEKDIGFYMSNHMFFAKMGLLLFVLILEVWPMITLIRWRRSLARDPSFDAASLGDGASMIAMISYVQCLLVVGMVLTAAGMSRGFGSR